MQKKLQDLLKMAEVSGSGDLNSIANQVQRLSKITSAQKNANLSTIQQFIPKVIYNLVNNIEQALPQTQQLSKVQLYAKVLRQLQQFAPPGSIDSSYVSTLDSARKDLQKRAKQITMDRVTQVKQNQLVNDLITQQINNSPQLAPPTLGLRLPPDTSYKGIQRQVEGIIDIIDNPPMTGILDTQSMPSTMKLLAKYAQQIGYKPTGQLTGKRSRAYVGINSVMEDDVQINKPFPFQQRVLSTGQNASIKQSYRYFAGQTITAWNDYVSCEEKFVDFANKISTKQKRQQYVSEQIKGMNKSTFCAQVLATLVHYYVVLPLRWMIRKTRRDIQQLTDTEKQNLYTYTWFTQNFQMPPGSNSNPLTLSYQTIKKLITELFKQGLSPAIYVDTTAILKDNALLAIGKTNLKKLTSYLSQKTFESSVYLKSLGIPTKTIDVIQKRPSVHNMIFSKVTFPTVYANTEVLALINKAIQKVDEDDPYQDKGQWAIKWQDQKIPAHDYIWGNSR